MFAVLLAAQLAVAQKPATAPRSDGHTTPLMIYTPAVSGTACAPLAIISHGAGGSEDGYRYLAQTMAQSGFYTIVMGHRESGLAALRSDMRAHGFKDGVQALVADPNAEQARLLDVASALAFATRQCRPTFRVFLGHSMGAETVMLEAGARNMIGVTCPPASQNRFDAYIALSPEGPGIIFPEHAWSEIHKPLLILTGTRDQSLKGGPAARQVPWHDLPGNAPRKCQWMGVITGATHMNFAGNGPGADNVEPLITQTIMAFLRDLRDGQGACTLPSPTAGMTLQAK